MTLPIANNFFEIDISQLEATHICQALNLFYVKFFKKN